MRPKFPALDGNQYGSTRRHVMLPALRTVRCYLQSSLHHHMRRSLSSAKHSAKTSILPRSWRPVLVCPWPTEALPDIPWHRYLQAVISLVEKLKLPQAVSSPWSWIAGSVSLPTSPFQTVSADTCARLAEHGYSGFSGELGRIVRDVWQLNDDIFLTTGKVQSVHPRNVMHQRG